MNLSTKSFWDSYYSDSVRVEGMEWYVDDDKIYGEIVNCLSSKISFPLLSHFPSILHLGCGVGTLSSLLQKGCDVLQPSIVMNFDVSIDAVKILQTKSDQEIDNNEEKEDKEEILDVICCSALQMPFKPPLLRGGGRRGNILNEEDEEEMRGFDLMIEKGKFF